MSGTLRPGERGDLLPGRDGIEGKALAHLFGTSGTTMRRTLTETRRLLDQHGRIEPVTGPPDLPARIPPYAPQTTGRENEIKSACLLSASR